MLDRDEDMLITGGRHPFLARYKVLDGGVSGWQRLLGRNLGKKLKGPWALLLLFDDHSIYRSARKDSTVAQIHQEQHRKCAGVGLQVISQETSQGAVGDFCGDLL